MGLPEPPELGATALAHGTFQGHAVIVTGGGTGLGKAIAIEFARLGAAVGILSRKQDHRRSGVAAVEALARAPSTPNAISASPRASPPPSTVSKPSWASPPHWSTTQPETFRFRPRT